ncbi:MAG: DUF433 domain-containing protein [Chitinophagaceae bacterium]
MDGQVINVDKEILGGTPVFFGTRVPIKNLFNYLETSESIETFLDDFEGVSKDQVIRLLEMSQKLIETSTSILNENLPEKCATKRLRNYSLNSVLSTSIDKFITLKESI